MGNSSSSFFEKHIKTQEEYVKKRKQDPDMQFLLQTHGKTPAHTRRQVEGYLRQEFNNTRKKDNYILDSCLIEAKNYAEHQQRISLFNP